MEREKIGKKNWEGSFRPSPRLPVYFFAPCLHAPPEVGVYLSICFLTVQTVICSCLLGGSRVSLACRKYRGKHFLVIEEHSCTLSMTISSQKPITCLGIEVENTSAHPRISYIWEYPLPRLKKFHSRCSPIVQCHY